MIRRSHRRVHLQPTQGGLGNTAPRASVTTRGLLASLIEGATSYRQNGLHMRSGASSSFEIQRGPEPQSVNAAINSLIEGRRVDATLYEGNAPLPLSDMQLGTCHRMEDSSRTLWTKTRLIRDKNQESGPRGSTIGR